MSPIVDLRGQSSQPGDHQNADTHYRRVVGPIESRGEDQFGRVTQDCTVLAATIDEIREQWKRRQMWHRAEKSLTLQAKALCRRLMQGDKKEAEVLFKSALNGGKHDLAETAYLAMAPLLDARAGIEKARLQVEKRGRVLAAQIFHVLAGVGEYVESTRGFGELSFFGIVGEAGDLGSYGNPAKLWKRMGLAVIGGERQRRKEGAAGIEHGYNPARRSLMWTIGDCIIRAGGPLKDLYDERKAYELVKTQAIAADPELRKRYSGSDKYAPLAHAHNRAKRYIEKRLLRDLWRAWRDAIGPSTKATYAR